PYPTAQQTPGRYPFSKLPDGNWAGQRLLASRFAAKRSGQRDRRDCHARHHVPARERQAEETPGGLVARRRHHRVDLVEDAVRAAAGWRVDHLAIGRTGPPAPFDTRMIDAEIRAVEHQQ